MATKQSSKQLSTTFDYFQPRLSLRVLAFVFVAVDLMVSGYLSYVKLTNVNMACGAAGDGLVNCNVVQNSTYSEMFGIPIAWIGFTMSLGILLFLLLENRIPFLQQNGTLIFFGVMTFGFLHSMWLVFVQFVLLQALCPWCLTHEAMYTLLFIVASVRLRDYLRAQEAYNLA